MSAGLPLREFGLFPRASWSALPLLRAHRVSQFRRRGRRRRGWPRPVHAGHGPRPGGHHQLKCHLPLAMQILLGGPEHSVADLRWTYVIKGVLVSYWLQSLAWTVDLWREESKEQTTGARILNQSYVKLSLVRLLKHLVMVFLGLCLFNEWVDFSVPCGFPHEPEPLQPTSLATRFAATSQT